jgi:hypothetical protein
VGRILRVKHGRPLVIDIVDQQDIFRNQWHKRRAYYVKQNYDILMTDSPTYDAHTPVEWTPNHVAKHMDAKTQNTDAKANVKAKSLESNTKGSKESKDAKGWVGLPID